MSASPVSVSAAVAPAVDDAASKKLVDEQMAAFPVIDLAGFLNKAGDHAADCKSISHLLHQFGILIVKDPRVDPQLNTTFLDMMEQYYEQPEDVRAVDARPEVHYQVGVTPEEVERARNHCARIKGLNSAEKPLTECPPEKDHKSRFFWRIGPPPADNLHRDLNMPAVVPKNFPKWAETMNGWGEKILDTVKTVSQMAAVGFGLPAETFTDKMDCAPHLLAPTGSDLKKFGTLNTVFAGYHYDLNFLTIHGKSRFSGLYVWTRDQRKMLVKVPDGCLLLQAGKQFEWLTGGHVLAGFHEVVVNEAAIAAKEAAQVAGRSLWRISSTLFGHIASKESLEPVAHFKNEPTAQNYPKITAGEQVLDELKAISLAQA
jgi:isopenicillin N synthase-like dioxygenase